ncbi:MAG: hypothetical protein R6U26_03030 [Candidatus Undinarchaeales archaeon]
MVLFCIPCLALILYFGIAGIFIPKYRTYYKDAWKCFLDKIKGKKCSVSFDNRMRLALSMWLTKKGFESAGKWFHKKRNFNLVLIIFVITTTILSIYLFALLIQYLQNSPCDTGSSCAI